LPVGTRDGARTAEHGFDDVIVPEDAADSEALLRLPQLEDRARSRALIVRGEGGRELLADTPGAARARACASRNATGARGPAAIRADCSRSGRQGRIDASIAMSTRHADNLWDCWASAGARC
jgi:uroporphyrinogen-III synthase